MINETYKAMLSGKSIIRELSEYATKRGEKIGYDNVFDYSLGNPSVPCAEDYTKAIIDMHETMNPLFVAYSLNSRMMDLPLNIAL